MPPPSPSARPRPAGHRRRRPLAFALLFVATALWRFYRQGLRVAVAPSAPAAEAATGAYGAHYAAAEGAELVVFYNLYVPHDEAGASNAVRVVEDQLAQIAEELRRSEAGEEEGGGGEEERRGVVLYNAIGNPAALPPATMTSLCRALHPRLACRLLRQHEEAGEDATLQDVHAYCSAPSRAARRVLYLHSKGSYHSQPENHVWRRLMTEAALRPACRRPPDAACDVCGAQFYVRYAVMFPGNMWTARCGYVATLLPPGDAGPDGYMARKEAAAIQFLTLELWGALAATLDTENGEHYGLGRYAWEHWVASSPHVRPCEAHATDVGPLMLLGKDPAGRTFGKEHYDWGMAPRRDDNLGGIRNARLRLESDEERQFREYYYLPGNLLKWFHLYGAAGVPAPDSWVWPAFPAGQRWKELVGRHGERAVDRMVEESHPLFHSAFAADPTDTADIATTLGAEEALSRPGTPPVVVFYQITFPADVNAKEKAVHAVISQFDVLYMGQDNQTILLYYAIAGGTSAEIELLSTLCKAKADRITCQPLGTHDDEGTYGEILQQLHAFCIIKPSFDVIHIANRLPGHDDPKSTFDASKIRTTTVAVTSAACRPAAGACDACGAEFYPLPFLHFAGNMFAASCRYVGRLLPPRTFEDRLNEVAGRALLGRAEGTYTTLQLPFSPRILGSYQHAAEHWIGAHPRLRPCAAVPPDGKEAPVSAVSAPRRDVSAPHRHGNLNGVNEARFRRKRAVALREYYYLAGNVLRWHRLYSALPDADSWAWRWFPDGPLWEAAARNSGEEAVHDLGRQLAIAQD